MQLSRTHKRLLILAVLSFVTVAMWGAVTKCLHDASSLVSRLDINQLAVLLGLCVLYRIVNAAGWTISLQALGTNLPVTTGTRIWLSSESCRWLPGGVWAYGSRAVLAKNAGVPVQTAAAATALELVVTLASWGFLAALALFVDAGSRTALLAVVPGSTTTLLAIALAGVTALAAVWKLRPACIMKQLERFAILKNIRPSARGVLTNFGFFVAVNLFNGLIVVWFVQQVFSVSVPVVLVVSANAAAWLVGFFALFAPGGLVVREATLAAILAAFLSPTDAIAVATLIRGLHLLSELACLPLLFLINPQSTKQAEPSRPTLGDSATRCVLP